MVGLSCFAMGAATYVNSSLKATAITIPIIFQPKPYVPTPHSLTLAVRVLRISAALMEYQFLIGPQNVTNPAHD